MRRPKYPGLRYLQALEEQHMAKKSRPTFQKRQKEQARQQKQQAKAARRLQAKQRRANGVSESSETALGTDGIQFAPQVLPATRDGVSAEEDPLSGPDPS
jgi:hypothetical protein